MQIRLESIIALFEKHHFLRKSLEGLRMDCGDIFIELKKFYEEVEAYALLDILVNNENIIDAKYMIWVKKGELPHIIEIKKHYSKTEYEVFSFKMNIEILEFEEMILATA